MSIGIRMSDCKFYVNKEKRTVVCVIPYTRDMLLDFIHDNFDFPDFSIGMGMTVEYELANEMPFSFTGKAVCSTNDKWNEETGRLLAFARAKNKCYLSFFKRANTLIQVLDRRLGDMMEVFNNLGMRLENRRDKLQEKIEARVAE